MKKLFVLATVLAFSVAVIAKNSTVKLNTEKTCAEWRDEGKCTRVADNATCAVQREAGKCPKAAAAKPATERTCAEFGTLGECTRVADNSTCAVQREAGKCPKHNATEAAKNTAEVKKSCGSGCGGCGSQNQQQVAPARRGAQTQRR
jgi:hypothetical protein